MNSSSHKISRSRAAVKLGFSRATISRKLSAAQDGAESALILQRLTLDRGAVPAGALAHFGRSSALLLKVLSQKPVGAASARTLARLAGVAPATATADLANLTNQGLVTHTEDSWQINWRASEWQAVAHLITQVKLPFHQPFGVRRPKYLPQRFWDLFHDVNPHNLEIDQNPGLVISRILNNNDLIAMSWMVRTFPPSEIAKAIAISWRELRSDREQLAQVLTRRRRSRGH